MSHSSILSEDYWKEVLSYFSPKECICFARTSKSIKNAVQKRIESRVRNLILDYQEETIISRNISLSYNPETNIMRDKEDIWSLHIKKPTQQHPLLTIEIEAAMGVLDDITEPENQEDIACFLLIAAEVKQYSDSSFLYWNLKLHEGNSLGQTELHLFFKNDVTEEVSYR